MKESVKTAWVERLRSGAYPQGKYQLRELGDLYDPVGVLCELAVSEQVIAPAKEHKGNPDSIFAGYTYEGLATGIPKAVEEWAELPYYLAYRVSILGDKGKKFDAIADWIEENL